MRERPYYILDENKNAVSTTMMQWARWFENEGREKRRVAFTQVTDNVKVSTIFLGIDHSFGSSAKPLIFETMVFEKGESVYCERSSSFDEALAQHEEGVKFAQEKDCPCEECTPN